MKRLTLLVVTASALAAAPAFAVNYCGGVWHQNVCNRPYNIYPCCDNGSNCTWWGWESMCRNWGIGPGNWGNANTWAGNANADPRFELVGPTVGAVATSTQGYYGHVAWSIGVNGNCTTVTEQNCCSTCSGSTITRTLCNKFNSGYVIRAGSQCSCTPGQVDKRACGNCGTEQRVCGSNCQWGGWGGCAGPDPEGGKQACSNGSLGVCADARSRCEGGWLACRSLQSPSAERCDGLDNDCDGETDEGNPTEGAESQPYAAQRIDLSAPRAAPSGGTALAWVEFRNVGHKTWEKGDVYLRAKGRADGVSPFRHDSWLSYQLAAGLDNPVSPGEVGRFTFTVSLPKTPGYHVKEHFQLEGAGTPIVCPDGELDIDVLVLNRDGTEAPAPAPVDGGEEIHEEEVEVGKGGGCTSAPVESAFALLVALFLGRRRVRVVAPVVALMTLTLGCGDATLVTANQPLTIHRISPQVVSARGGETLTLHGAGFTENLRVQVGERTMWARLVTENEATVRLPPLLAGTAPLRAFDDGSELEASLESGLKVLPLELRFVEAPPHSLPLPAGTVDSATAVDLDFNGNRDILTCGATCNAYFNDGNSNFFAADAGITALPAPAKLLAASDLNGDAFPDLVLSNGGVYLSDKAVFSDTPALTFEGLEAIAFSDLDGDGKKEAIIAAAGFLEVRALVFDAPELDGGAPEAEGDVGEDDGDGGFVNGDVDAGVVEDTPQPLPIPAARQVLAADLDGDGDDDIIVSTVDAPGSVALRLFLNEKGRLREVAGGLPGSPVKPVMALAIGDMNGDGALDLVAVGDGQDRLLLNDGAAHFFDATPAMMPVDNSPGTSVALVDLDRDRDLDIVIGNATGAARLYINQGTGRFADQTPLLPVASRALSQVLTADFDGDGDEDILLVGQSAPDTRLYLSVEPRP